MYTAYVPVAHCPQAIWGSAHYSLDEPLHITQVRDNTVVDSIREAEHFWADQWWWWAAAVVCYNYPSRV